MQCFERCPAITLPKFIVVYEGYTYSVYKKIINNQGKCTTRPASIAYCPLGQGGNAVLGALQLSYHKMQGNTMLK